MAIMTSTLRQTVTALGVAGVAGASLLGLTGTAAAATTSTSSCTGTVGGHSGDALRMDAKAVKSQVLSAVRNDNGLLILKSDREKVEQAYAAGKIKPLSLGTVKSSTYKVSGSTIASAVISRLEHTDGLQSVAENSTNQHNIRSKVGSACGLTVKVASTAAHRSSSSGSSRSTSTSTSQHHASLTDRVSSATSAVKRWPSESTPSTTSKSKQSTAKAHAPEVNTADGYKPTPGRRAKRDYSGIPVAKPGTAPDGSAFDPNRFGAAPNAAKSPYLSDQVNKTGDANALPPGQGGPIPVPLLVAVIALAGASAGLVRTWMLRRLAAQ